MDQPITDRRGARWTNPEIELLIRRLREGKSEKEIALEFHRRQNGITCKIDQLIRTYHDAGYSSGLIIDMLHLNPNHVSAVVINYQLKKNEINMNDIFPVACPTTSSSVIEATPPTTAPTSQPDEKPLSQTEGRQILTMCTEIRDMLTAMNISMGRELDQRMVRANSAAISGAAKKVLECMGELHST